AGAPLARRGAGARRRARRAALRRRARARARRGGADPGGPRTGRPRRRRAAGPRPPPAAPGARARRARRPGGRPPRRSSGRPPRRSRAVKDRRLHETSVELEVPFHDVDALRIVWHGHYLKYFEIARTALLRARGLDAGDLVGARYQLVVVESHCRHGAPLRYGDRIRVSA